MIKILLDIFLIHLIVVCIVDRTDFPSSAKKALSWLLTKGVIVKEDYSFHLIDCSTCISWWLSLLYIILTGHLSLLTVAIAILLATFTHLTKSLIILVEDSVVAVIQFIYKKFIDDEDNYVQ